MNYVYITPELSGIGGAQQYAQRKLRDLTQRGIRIAVITGNDNNIVMEGLKKYPRCVIPEIAFPLILFSTKKREIIRIRVHNFIYKELDFRENVMFESANIMCGTWGDYFAERFRSISFIYDLNGLPIKEKSLASFASFKFLRSELIGCSRYSNQMLFSNFPEYYDSSKNNYVNVPFSRSEIEDDNDKLYNTKNPNVLKILTISRIDKKYLFYLISEVSKIARTIQNKTIELTMILDRKSGKAFNRLCKHSQDIPKNMKVIFLGPAIPLKKTHFVSQDLFIGGGTAALNAASIGIPVIINDADSNNSAGIFGIDIDFFGYSPNYDKTTSSQIQRFLKKTELLSEASEKGLLLFEEEFEDSVVSNRFMENVEKIMKQKPEYFSYNDIILSGREKIKKVVMFLSGVKGYHYLAKNYAKYRNYFKIKRIYGRIL